ncbi:glutathione S-transferase C-terminal domain-containing protein [Cohnella terricola]|uniref:Glutathione S-transferase family protein n=1 Tax=Cohnella terricola TaxID=1289167 RepID=A0A559JJ27_9BACL|nr:glutathione S-transferase C-terminal domain-containing protein [Cohnella terricola]TVX99869.1 glutathione S-transferase family protein [Cohnella terricola]
MANANEITSGLTTELSKETCSNVASSQPKIQFTTPFGNGEGELPIEANRYRIVWAQICLWAQRVVIVRSVLGLEDVISVGTTSSVRSKQGWAFSLDEGGIDPVLNIQYLSEIYKETDPGYDGRVTVPAVVDVLTRKVVNNDSYKLPRYLETVWAPFHKEGAPDLYPKHLRSDIDELNEIIIREVTNNVRKASSALWQEEYEAAYAALFARLDQLEERLSARRYLFGDQITDSDIELYVTLVRLDIVYNSHYRTERNKLQDFPNLSAYARDLYQTPGFGDTTDFDAIKRGFYLRDAVLNPDGLASEGPDLSFWRTPHGRF